MGATAEGETRMLTTPLNTTPLNTTHIMGNYAARRAYESQRHQGAEARNAYGAAKLAYAYDQLNWDDHGDETTATVTTADGYTVEFTAADGNEYGDDRDMYEGSFSNSWEPGAINSAELQRRMTDFSHYARIRDPKSYSGWRNVRLPRRLRSRKNRTHSYESWGLYRLETGRYWVPEKWSTVAAILPYMRRTHARHEAYLKALAQVRTAEKFAADGLYCYDLTVTVSRGGVEWARESTLYTTSQDAESFWIMDVFNDLHAEVLSTARDAVAKAEAERLATIYARVGVTPMPLWETSASF